MDDRVDLHIHSNKSSDGDYAPPQIIQLAKAAGLKTISISDHDTVAAYPEAQILGKDENIEVIPSVELTTQYDGREFHLLLPFVDWESKAVENLVSEVTQRRFMEAKARVSRLQELGFSISWDEVIDESAPFPPLGVTIAQVLLKKAKREDDPAFKKYFSEENVLYAPFVFYKDYFAEGKPAFVTRRNVQLLDVLELAEKTGGVPVLAHPGASFQKVNAEDLRFLSGKGLEGLEVITPYHDKQMEEYYTSCSDEFDLVPTIGSDFHGSIKPHISLGDIEGGGFWMVEELRKRRP
jgi:predicted metal-dependent phosphoesterase TrpH